ncbi:MAG: MBL fold metallo-hydrolase [Planctomycetes bacterium]|nr:MBL fold metallo-hydrolase [Planctomycetota bacterium]
MKLHFLGANRQVTGSKYCIDSMGQQVMIDCGMFQERPFEDRNWHACPIPQNQVDALLLTHVHIDHSGLIPRLVREGFRGPIYTTRASVELAEVVLRDAAKIQNEDANYKARRHAREGRKSAYPERVLFTDLDVTESLKLFQPISYGQPFKVFDHLQACFFDAGHILGSAMIQLDVTEQGRTRRIVFSGDIGQHDKPLIRDPTFLTSADYAVMESTYGDREHRKKEDVETQLEKIICETARRGGNVVIPTFAVERAQELMFYISRLVNRARIPRLKVFVDSPMAVDVTEIYRGLGDFFDEETLAMMADNRPPLRFPGLTFCRSVNESRAINNYRKPCIIMASSGMCTAGRIKHHLRQNLGRSESTILFVGYQGQGTLGRTILEGNPIVRIHGQEFKVRAQIQQIFGFSGHADRSGLLEWLGNISGLKRLFLTHGEESVAQHLAAEIRDRWKLDVSVPAYQEEVELS